MDFKGKKGLIFGIANHRSIAYFIAKELSALGAEIGYSYQAERVRGSVEKSLKDLNPSFIEECDVLNKESLTNFFKLSKEKLSQIDFIVHSIAFAEREECE